VAGLVGFCDGELVMEKFPRDLQTQLFDKTIVLSTETQLQYARDVTRGLAQLHGVWGGPVAHTDLLLKQFLLNERGEVLLTDFNRAQFAERGCTNKYGPQHGTQRAPEELAHVFGELDKGAVGVGLLEKVDSYQMGTVLYQIWSRRAAFPSLNQTEVMNLVARHRTAPDIPREGYPRAHEAVDPEVLEA
jgi:hypothetical protein